MIRPHLLSAFTLIELMVAMVIASVMIFLIQVMFVNTSDVIRQGTGISAIIGNARAVDAQLHKDAALMMGPGGTEEGFLVIINRKIEGEDNEIPGIPFLDSRGNENLEYRGDQVSRHTVRSDQLVFIVNASRLKPICPQNADTFASYDSSSATHARLFYGHVRRIHPDDPNGPDVESDELSESGELGADSKSSSELNLNQVATNWILGRQALFFDGAVGDDVQHQDYDDILDNLYEGKNDTVNINYRSVSPIEENMGENYLTEILREPSEPYWEYVAKRFAFPKSHLWVRPELPMGLNPEDSILSSDIAQQHGIFAANVSDFIVEFAADIIDDNGDGEPDGDVDRNEDDNSIIWYSHFSEAFNFPDYSPYEDVTDDNDYPNADGVFVWHHPDAAGNSLWPSLIRIRYRIHDPTGQVISNIRETIDQEYPDDYPIRYLRGEKMRVEMPGRWFEQIIQVKRPST